LDQDQEGGLVSYLISLFDSCRQLGIVSPIKKYNKMLADGGGAFFSYECGLGEEVSGQESNCSGREHMSEGE
jgi:hypothetical protein